MKGFRLARPASVRCNFAKTAVQIVCMWGTFLVALPQALLYGQNRAGIAGLVLPGQRAFAVVVFLAASAVGLASAYVVTRYGEGTPLPLDAARRLVIRGPYRYVRNPMAVAGLAQGACVGLWYGSWVILVYVALGACLWQFGARPREEEFLLGQFGARYARYRELVRCWLPHLTAYDERAPQS